MIGFRRIPRSLWVPLALLPVWLALPRLLPMAAAPGVVPDWLRFLPGGLILAAVLLGGSFNQSRVTFSALLLGAAMLAVDRIYFLRPAGQGDPRIVLLAGVLLPLGLAVFYRLNERGVFTSFGLARLTVTAVAAGLLLLWPRAAVWPDPTLAAPVGVWVRLPASVLVAAVGCLPAFALPKAHETRVLGAFLALTLLYALLALNFRAVLWPGVQARTVLYLFTAGAAFTLVMAVLDAAWRGATLDELTQLPSRRALHQRLARLGAAATIGLLDIDHFKQINDRHGHDTGDQILRFVAARLRTHFGDRAFRLGGEEFVLLALGADREARVADLEAARQAIGETPFLLRAPNRPRRKPEALPDAPAKGGGQRRELRVTASLGAAHLDAGDPAPLDALHAADAALYRAKAAGRDRLALAPKPRKGEAC